MKKIILILLFLLIGAYIIITAYNLDIKDGNDQKTFTKIFASWISKLWDNVKHITALVIKQEWLPDTNKTKDD